MRMSETRWVSPLSFQGVYFQVLGWDGTEFANAKGKTGKTQRWEMTELHPSGVCFLFFLFSLLSVKCIRWRQWLGVWSWWFPFPFYLHFFLLLSFLLFFYFIFLPFFGKTASIWAGGGAVVSRLRKKLVKFEQKGVGYRRSFNHV